MLHSIINQPGAVRSLDLPEKHTYPEYILFANTQGFPPETAAKARDNHTACRRFSTAGPKQSTLPGAMA
jgi:hypothetical protein